MYKVLNILPSGVFAIEKYYDENYVFVPIEFAQDLLEYDNKITAYEIYLDEDANARVVQDQLTNAFGDDFKVHKGMSSTAIFTRF